MHIVIKKLRGYAHLSDEDVAAFEEACEGTLEVSARQTLVREGDCQDYVLLVLAGWACRFKILEDGSRQILAFLIPGDFCDMCASVIGKMDHDIGTLTEVTVARIRRGRLEALLAERPVLTKAILWTQLVDEAVTRAWLVNIGRRDAYSRLANLLCELWTRFANLGLVSDNRIDLPITQEEISDALGLTAVHLNRVLQRLRNEGLIQLRQGRLSVLDAQRLALAGEFDGSHLHPRKTEASGRAQTEHDA